MTISNMNPRSGGYPQGIKPKEAWRTPCGHGCGDSGDEGWWYRGGYGGWGTGVVGTGTGTGVVGTVPVRVMVRVYH